MRQRKDGSGAAGYTGKQIQTEMKDAALTELTVAGLLARWPQAIPVFLRHQMACVGCTMSPFETVSDVTAVYNIPLPHFVNELQQAIEPPETNL